MAVQNPTISDTDRGAVRNEAPAVVGTPLRGPHPSVSPDFSQLDQASRSRLSLVLPDWPKSDTFSSRQERPALSVTADDIVYQLSTLIRAVYALLDAQTSVAAEILDMLGLGLRADELRGAAQVMARSLGRSDIERTPR